jgi:hypothetical protein
MLNFQLHDDVKQWYCGSIEIERVKSLLRRSLVRRNLANLPDLSSRQVCGLGPVVRTIIPSH